MEENNKVTKERNIAYEIMMVVVGSFLIFVSFIGASIDFDTLLDDDEKKNVTTACNARDKVGNYSSEDIECVNDFCYIKKDDYFISSNCEDGKNKKVSKEDYDKILDNASKVKSLCNYVDENGLYLNERNDYCENNKCYIKDNDIEYRSECPSVIPQNEEEKIPDNTKKNLKDLCEKYLKGEVIKDELSECIYGSCKISDADTLNTYTLSCDKNLYRLLDEDEAEDDAIIKSTLFESCNKDMNISSNKENVRCYNGICSFHYKQGNYFKKCDK